MSIFRTVISGPFKKKQDLEPIPETLTDLEVFESELKTCADKLFLYLSETQNLQASGIRFSEWSGKSSEATFHFVDSRGEMRNYSINFEMDYSKLNCDKTIWQIAAQISEEFKKFYLYNYAPWFISETEYLYDKVKETRDRSKETTEEKS